jgi:O-antigen/teichoic acid export membrane protein
VLKQKLKTSFLSKLFVQLFQLGATIVVARIAGPTVLGTIAFGLAFVNMFAFIGSLGLGSAHVKIIHEEEDKAKCAGTYAILHIASKLMFFFIVIIYFVIQKYVLHFPFESRDHEIVIMIFMGMILVNTLSEIPQANFAANMEQAKQDIPEIIRNLFLQPARIITVLLGGVAISLAFVNLVSAIIVIPVYWYLSRNIKYGKFDFNLSKRYFKYGIPLVVLALASSLGNTIDKVILQYFTNSETVGYYTAGFKIGGYFLIIGQSAGMLFYPYFSKVISNNEEFRIEEKISQYENFLFLFVMPVMIFLSIYSHTLVMAVLGKQYIPSIPVLTIITLAQFIFLLNIPYGNLLSGMGYFKLVAIVNIVFIIVFTLLLVCFVHPQIFNLSAKGAAYAFFLSKTFLAAMYVFFGSRKMAVFNVKRYFKFLSFGLITFLLFYFIYIKCVIGNTGLTIIFPGMFFLFSYISYYLFGWMKNDDWNLLLSALHLKPMLIYIKQELFKK